jgi:Spy/CpxP family protein refolding chaperone
MNETNPGRATAGRRGRRWLWVGGGVLALALVLTAVAPRAMAFRQFAHGHGFGHGPGRHAFGAQILKDPAAAKEHAGLAAEFVLRGVNASDEQKEKVRQVTDRLVDQLGPIAARHHELHAALVRELGKPEIDRAAIEKIRQQGMALADEASKLALAGLEDVGDVLTAEQRAELIELGRRFHRDR